MVTGIVDTIGIADLSATMDAAGRSGFNRERRDLPECKKAAGIRRLFLFFVPEFWQGISLLLAGHRRVALLNDAAAMTFR